MSFKQSVI